jgi:5'-3' exonuclease
MFRALLALLVGCDARPGGVKGKGPMVAYKLLKKYDKQLSGGALHDKLADDISTMKGASVKDKDAVICLAKSLLFRFRLDFNS